MTSSWRRRSTDSIQPSFQSSSLIWQTNHAQTTERIDQARDRSWRFQAPRTGRLDGRPKLGQVHGGRPRGLEDALRASEQTAAGPGVQLVYQGDERLADRRR